MGRLWRCHVGVHTPREGLALLHVSKPPTRRRARPAQSAACSAAIQISVDLRSSHPRALRVLRRWSPCVWQPALLPPTARASAPITSQSQPSQKPRSTRGRQHLTMLWLPSRAYGCAARGGSRAAPCRVLGAPAERRWRARYPAGARRDGSRADISCNSTQQRLTYRLRALRRTACRVPITAVREPSVQ